MPKCQPILLQESATSTTLAETRPALVAEAAGEGGRFRVQLIDSGWGSSGFYSPEVLAEAARQRVFAEGTQMFADHPRGDGSGLDAHGNRSVQDLWAVLASDASVDESTGALVAEAQVFAPYRGLVADMASSIGLSIRATGTYEVGEAEGRSGHLITSLDEGLSVDFVVAAGRGGRILELVESARGEALTESVARAQLLEARNVGQWIESRLHLSLTQIADDMFGEGRLTREERIALSSAVGDGLQAFTASLEASSPQLYQRDLWADPVMVEAVSFDTVITRLLEAVPLQADQPSGRAVTAWLNEAAPKAGLTNNVPVSPAGRSTTTESQGGTMPQIEEARLRQLEADAGRAAVLESERDAATAERDTAQRALAESTARTAARPVVGEVFTGHQLPASTYTRVTEALITAASLTDADQLDEAALRTSATAARTAAETELAEALAAAGVGKVRGLGSSTSTALSEAETTATSIARRRAGTEA